MVEFDSLTARPYVQVLDESMCVVREDINDWLQRYLFDTEDVGPINPNYLLYRLSSGVWLARLAYKLHHTVFAQSENSANNSNPLGALRRRHLSQKKNGTSFRFSSTLLGIAKKTLTELEFECPFYDFATSEASSIVSTHELDCSQCKVCTFGSSDSQTNMNLLANKCSHTNSKSSFSESLQSRSFNKNSISISKHWEFRSNVTAFLDWCKDLGIQETVLFETNGLIHKTEEKNVLLTLMEITRLASYYGLADLPELVRMEREIEALEEQEALNGAKTEEERLQIISQTNQDGFNMTNSSSSIASFSSIPNEINNNLNNSDINTSPGEVRQKKNASGRCTGQDPESGDQSQLVDSDDHGTVFNGGNLNRKIKSQDHVSDKKPYLTDLSLNINRKYHDQECKTSASSSGVGGSSDEESLHSDIITSLQFQNDLQIPKNEPPDTLVKEKVHLRAPEATMRSKLLINRKISVDKAKSTSPDLSRLGEKLSRKNNQSDERKIPQPGFASSSRKSSVSDLPPTKIPIPHSTPARGVRGGSQPKAGEGQLCKSSSGDSLFTKSKHIVPTPKAHTGLNPRLRTPSLDSLNSITNPKRFKDNDVYNLVHKKIYSCACHDKLNFQRIDEGRYRLGNRVYYLRKFRSHIMVRVGGGWLTLDEFLMRNDPCRKSNFSSRIFTRTNSYSEAHSLSNKNAVKIEWNKGELPARSETPDLCNNRKNSRILDHGVLMRNQH